MNDRNARTVETFEVLGPDAEARGRNGWFRPASVSVRRSEASRTIAIAARSVRRYSDMPPIHLSLALDDARRLHEAIGRQIATLDAAAAEEGAP